MTPSSGDLETAGSEGDVWKISLGILDGSRMATRDVMDSRLVRSWSRWWGWWLFFVLLL